MATVQQRIEVWTGELWDTAPVYQVLLDSVRDVISELNPDSLTPLWVELTDSGSGVSTVAYKVLEARKGLYKAVPISPSFRTAEAIDEENPVTYTMGGKTYVLPSGGTVLALAYPAVKLSDVSVTSVQEPLMTLFVLRAAEGTLHHLMHQLTLGLSDVLTMPTPPSAPVPPTISASDAAAVAPTAVAIGGLPTAPVYTAPTLASRLNPTAWVLSIGDLTPPSAPAEPTIAYTPAVAAVVSDVTIEALPTVPAFQTPVFGGNLALPALPALSVILEADGVTALNPPSPPSAPVIASVDAAASTAAATTIAALGTAPTYLQPAFGGSLALPTLTTPDFSVDVTNGSALATPTVPTAPNIAAIDPVAATVVATTIASLGTAPAYTLPPYQGSLALPSLPTPDFYKDVATTADLPSPTAPTAPSIVAVDPIAATVVATTISALGTAPVFTKPVFEGLLAVPAITAINVLLEADGSSANDPPVAPSAPNLFYLDASAASAVATSVGALGTAPTYAKPVFAGTAAIPTLPTLAYTNGVHGTALVVPAAPATPSLDYIPAPLAAFAAAASVGALPALPTMSVGVFEGTISAITSAIPAILDLESKFDDSTANTPPTAPTAPAFLSPGITDVAISFVSATAPIFVPPTVGLTFTTWTTYQQSEDPEIMREVLNKVALELQETQTKLDAAGRDWANQVEVYRAQVQKAIEQARIDLSERQTELTERNRSEVEEYAASLRRYETQIAEYQAYVTTKVAQFNAALQRATAGVGEAQRLYVQKYSADIQQNVAAYQGAMQDHLRECDRLMQQATLDQERLVALFRTETDLGVQNAIQRAQVDIAEYAQALGRYREQVAHLQMDIAMIHQKWDLDYKKAVEPWIASQRIAMEQYAADIQNERAKFEVDMALYRATSERNITQAQVTLQEALANARTSSDVSAQNRAAHLQASIADWQADVEVFNVGLARYERELQRVLQKWEADFKRAVEPWGIEQSNRIAKYRTDLEAEVADFQRDVAEYQQDAQHKIEQARLTLQQALSNAQMNTEVSVQARAAQLQAAVRDWEADVEVFNTSLAKYDREIARTIEEWKAAYQKAYEPWAAQQQQALQLYASDLQAANTKFERDVAEYRQDAEKKLAQAQITLQEAIANARTSTDVSIQARAAALQAQVRDWEADVEVFNTSLAKYDREIQRTIEEWKAAYQKAFEPWAAQQRLYIEQYAADVQNSRTAFERDLAEYQQDAQKKLAQAQTTLAEALANARASTDVSVQNEAQRLQGFVATWQGAVAQFGTALETYRAEAQRVLDKYDRDFRSAYDPWAQQQGLLLQEFQTALSVEQTRFGGEMQDHMREVDRILEKARFDAQRLAQQAQSTTEVALQNEVQALQAAVADWSASIDLFRGQIQLYQAQVEARIAEFSALSGADVRLFEAGGQIDVARYSGEVSSARAALEADMARHRAAMDHLQLIAQIARQEAEQTAALSTEVALRNKAQTLAASVASWEATLGAFRASVEFYAAEVRATLEARQVDQAAREAKLNMLARSRDRVRIMYNEAKVRFERAFTRYRPINVAFREF